MRRNARRRFLLPVNLNTSLAFHHLRVCPSIYTCMGQYFENIKNSDHKLAIEWSQCIIGNSFRTLIPPKGNQVNWWRPAAASHSSLRSKTRNVSRGLHCKDNIGNASLARQDNASQTRRKHRFLAGHNHPGRARHRHYRRHTVGAIALTTTAASTATPSPQSLCVLWQQKAFRKPGPLLRH